MENVWSPPLQFNKITRINHGEWPKYWLRETQPGTLLLFKDDAGGILRLTKEGMFISITKEQALSAALVVWPGRNSEYDGIKILGTKIEVIRKE